MISGYQGQFQAYRTGICPKLQLPLSINKIVNSGNLLKLTCLSSYFLFTMSLQKVSHNQTGTLFYTKMGEGETKPYRVRFRSFHLGVYENKEKAEDLQNMQTNYNLFKYGKAYGKRNSMPVISQDTRSQKTYKNMNSRRCIQSEQLKTRLRSMRQTRKSILYKIKNLNE